MKVVFTGGGTAGHAMVNTILIPLLKKENAELIYIGSKEGIEKKMMASYPYLSYLSIQTGKLRRYFSLKNVTDIFRIIIGFFQAYSILRKEDVQLVYSSGGYVAVPVVWAAYLQGIPVILRETDYSIGLANRLCLPCAKDLFLTFFETDVADYDITSYKEGMIIRPELIQMRDDSILEPTSSKPVCLVIGGSNGAEKINKVIWDNLEKLTEDYVIVHITGKGKKNAHYLNSESYQQIEFIEEIGKFYAKADIVIGRSGSNVVSECLLLGKKMICIPLSSTQSRGEQTLNANFAQKYGNAIIIDNQELDGSRLMTAISEIRKMPINDMYKIEEVDLNQRISKHLSFIQSKALTSNIK